MSRESTLMAGRAAAETAYQDTIEWRRPTGDFTQDESTGAQDPEYAPIHTGPAKVALGTLRSLVPTVRESIRGGAEVTTLRSIVHLPVDTPQLRANDVGTVVAIGPYTDEQVLGKVFTVVGPVGQSYATARRFSVDEVLG